MTHADFRPKKRSGVVPSGKPRRKIPLLRILLLILVAFFIYLKFDSIYAGVRGTLNPGGMWGRIFHHSKIEEDNLAHPAWSSDSTEFTLDCATGLKGCCDGAPAGGTGLCRQAAALLAKAQARRIVGPVSSNSPARLFARRNVSRAGLEVFDLTAVQGREGSKSTGSFILRRNSAGAWCDSRSVCLGEPSPQAPLLFGRLMAGPGSSASWVSGSSSVHPVLPGRIVSVDSVTGGVRIRIYHGGELYTSYEPLHQVPGASLKTGTPIDTRTVLGDAPWLNAGYTLLLRVRRGGVNLDPADFFRLQTVAAAAPEDSAATSENVP